MSVLKEGKRAPLGVLVVVTAAGTGVVVVVVVVVKGRVRGGEITRVWALVGITGFVSTAADSCN